MTAPNNSESTSNEDREALRNFPPGAPPTSSPYNSLSSNSGGVPDNLLSSDDGTGGRAIRLTNPVSHTASTSELVRRSSAPVDNYHSVFMIFILLGVSVLLNWNTFITAYDYFHLTMDSDDFEFYFTLIFNIPCFLTNLVMLQYGQLIPLKTRIVGTQMIFLGVLISLPIVGDAHHTGKISQHTTNALIYTLCGITGLSTGVSFPSTSGLAAMFPPKYMTATMSGVGFGGVIVGVIRILTRAALPTDDSGTRKGSRIYFTVGATTMFMAALSYLVLLKLPFAKHWFDVACRAKCSAEAAENDDVKGKPLLDDDALTNGRNGSPSGGFNQSHADDAGEDSDSSSAGIEVVDVFIDKSKKGNDCNCSSYPEVTSGKINVIENGRKRADSTTVPQSTTMKVLGKTWVIQASIYISFAVTIGLFPGVATLIDSQKPSFSEWFKIVLVSLFLLFDWIGRSLPNFFMLFNTKNVWIPCLCRLIFFPLFIFCVKPHLFHSDAIPYSIMIVFALTNGYLCTSLMTLGPGLVLPHEMETVGIMTVFSLNGGILTGAGLGIMFSHILG